jgi:hypothetical protein
MFRDYVTKIRKKARVQKQTGASNVVNARKEKQWLKQSVVSFTFKKDMFLPNPDAYFFDHVIYSDYIKRSQETD